MREIGVWPFEFVAETADDGGKGDLGKDDGGKGDLGRDEGRWGRGWE